MAEQPSTKSLRGSGSKTLAQPKPIAKPTTRSTNRTQKGQIRQRNVHGFGLTAGDVTGMGFTYRHYFGRTAIQATLLPVARNRGKDVFFSAGLQVSRYLFFWQNQNPYSWRPNVGLRISGAVSYLHVQDTDSESVNLSPTCVDVAEASCPTTTVEKENVRRNLYAGGSIGFEFGQIFQPGLSFAVDLNLRGQFNLKNGIQLTEFIPMPSGSLLFNW
tara:strand:+ start:453 stop:1100 length:648 start_codon:yes stop_codon:yes gene_type:complete